MLQHPNIWPVQYKTVSPDRLHSIVDCDPTAWRDHCGQDARDAAEACVAFLRRGSTAFALGLSLFVVAYFAVQMLRGAVS